MAANSRLVRAAKDGAMVGSPLAAVAARMAISQRVE